MASGVNNDTLCGDELLIAIVGLSSVSENVELGNDRKQLVVAVHILRRVSSLKSVSLIEIIRLAESPPNTSLSVRE